MRIYKISPHYKYDFYVEEQNISTVLKYLKPMRIEQDPDYGGECLVKPKATADDNTVRVERFETAMYGYDAWKNMSDQAEQRAIDAINDVEVPTIAEAAE